LLIKQDLGNVLRNKEEEANELRSKFEAAEKKACESVKQNEQLLTETVRKDGEFSDVV
jgi:hypothetical protein